MGWKSNIKLILSLIEVHEFIKYKTEGKISIDLYSADILSKNVPIIHLPFT